MINWKVPLSDVDFGDEEVAAVVDVLRSRWLSMGPVTEEFERRFAEYVGVKHAFAVANGTAALHMAHTVLGSGPGDTVLCPSLTFVATANAIRYTGATPVFVDITSGDDLNSSPDDIESRIDESTKGICVMHYAGYPCNMQRIMEIAGKRDLYVVEDAAHAPGAATWMEEPGERGGMLRKCGSVGDIGCFSFFANKNMAIGEGGMLTTNVDVVADKVRLLRSHGMTSLTWDRHRGHRSSYDVVELGYNYRLDEMRSALGLVQLRKLEGNNEKRAEVARRYLASLQELEEISIPFRNATSVAAHHIFPIVVKHRSDRSRLMDMLREKGIQTSVHYPPVHAFSHYSSLCPPGSVPLTDDVAAREVTLPLYSTMTVEQSAYVSDAIKQWAVARRH